MDGSFWVEGASHPLGEETVVAVGGRRCRVTRRGGTVERPLVRLDGIADREAAAGLRGKELEVSLGDAPLEDDEWLAADLVGCQVPGVGRVRRVVRGPSCDLLVVGDDEALVPFISDAVRRVDAAARVIDVDLRFLSLGGHEAPPTRRA